jgi:hypothetical protein
MCCTPLQSAIMSGFDYQRGAPAPFATLAEAAFFAR